ncbi:MULTISPECIES: mannose-1-phosphate guanylyltransferase [Halanaerobium]|uniref:mannose-1-phosphate guanylyltransferase n=1 Tax=Halanaerobium congolense TaxID=54121 RepID=A0A4R8GEQ5_9FIRM|nr:MULTISPECIES: mannose-1-phosphate guanylyltransferase [Halanaerobium]PUU86212.1 MAG: mannose-1-phosphate guanylyltransferase [Halanaerobium sp.]TDX43655.1 mannose-1-phosphate guanylyltransferase [Halanaerobium congolense]
MITALIMAGGEGTRFWPLSRKDNPKQFLKLNDEKKTMLQETVERISGLVPLEQVFIATNEAYQKAIKKQLDGIPKENIIVEPMKRNTAACIGLSSVVIENKYPGSTMIVLPADHLIKDEKKFVDILSKAVMTAATGKNLVTLGIKPTHPETGYGYIHYGDHLHTIDGDQVFEVQNFTEKPDLDTAKEFLNDGNYLWNSGMFIWRLDSILYNIEKYLPEMYKSLANIKNALGTDLEQKVIKNEFKQMESVSIDYGIMEKADDIFVIPSSFGWDDLGSWPALERIKKIDDNGNVVVGKHYGIDTTNSIIHSPNKVVTTIGLDDVVIVDTEDAILICDKNRAQEVKEIRKILADEGLGDCL